MARDPNKMPGKKGDRGGRPVSRIIDLSATEITPEPGASESPHAIPQISKNPMPDDAASTPRPETPGDAETPAAEAPASAETAASPPGSAAPEAAIPVMTVEETPQASDAAEAAQAEPAADAAPEAPAAEQPSAAGEAATPPGETGHEEHGIDTAVFDRPSGGSTFGAIIFGSLAGIAASLVVLFGLSEFNLMPGAPDLQQRLAGVEASIRSIVEQGGQFGGKGADPSAARTGEIEALTTRIDDLSQRLAAVQANAPEQDAGAAAALAGDIDALKGQLGDVRSSVAALPQNIGEQLTSLQAQLGELDSNLGALQTTVGELSHKQEDVSTAVEELHATADQIGQARAQIDQLQTQVGQLDQLRTQLGDIAKRQDELTTGFSGLLAASKTAADNQGKLDALAGEVNALTERQKLPPEDLVARRLVLLDLIGERLRTAAPFAAEAAALAQLDGSDAAALRAVADAGVPTGATLAAQARSALAGLAKPAAPGTPFLQQLADSARSLVTVTPLTEGAAARAPAPPSDDRAVFVERLRAGDLQGALTAYETLDSAAKAAVADIAEQAKARLAAEQNLAALRGETLAAAAKRS